MDIHIILFYKFQQIADVNYFKRKHLKFCKDLGVFGKVLIAEEGINGSISGSKEQIETYKKYVHNLDGFNDVWFKEEIANSHPFTKMVVRIKKEIIRIDRKVDMSKKGEYISPQEFLQWYNRQEDFIVIDARNYYEYHLGKFKNAINPNLSSFRGFPQFVESLKQKTEKNKKIITYCTGGIRCEKASAYLKEQGFVNVYQLEGGIINFCQQFPNTVWEGKCFVFDKRLMSDINQKNKPITQCESCGELCDLYKNCRNRECDKLTILCTKCDEKLQGCCSKKCMNEFIAYARERAVLKKQGLWQPKEILQNYAK
ncbi:MAG: hypothetical protein RL557_490 [archaeon]|jgi:UPF0176 protein